MAPVRPQTKMGGLKSPPECFLHSLCEEQVRRAPFMELFAVLPRAVQHSCDRVHPCGCRVDQEIGDRGNGDRTDTCIGETGTRAPPPRFRHSRTSVDPLRSILRRANPAAPEGTETSFRFSLSLRVVKVKRRDFTQYGSLVQSSCFTCHLDVLRAA